MEDGRLTFDRGGVFWEGKGCCGGVEEYDRLNLFDLERELMVDDVGIAPLSESSREKATHQEMINSMKK